MQSRALKFHLETLESPLPSGATLMLNAAPGSYLHDLKDHQITVITHLASTANQWSEKKVETHFSTDEKFDTIIHFATKFATENLATVGKYIQQLKPNGTWITIIPNRTGASRLKNDLKKLFPAESMEIVSKAKCRIFQASSECDLTLARKWASLNKPKPVKNTELVTQPGIFSAEKIDTGSALLAEILKEESWYGAVGDLGSGYGFLSHAILSTPRQRIKDLHLIELDQRALDCAQLNLAPLIADEKIRTTIHSHWADLTQTLPKMRSLETIVMNPPFHEAQDASFELGRTFIAQAAKLLKPGGTLYLVANLHLPYEKQIQETFRSHRLLKEEKGFKIFLARA